MSFQELDNIIYIAPAILIFFFLYQRHEKNALSWIKRYFFKEPTKAYYLKTFCFYMGFILVGLAALDLRGPEEQVKVEVQNQKTVILIDTSRSMSVEDVKPNRFEKALMVAMHFVKNSTGHKIAVFIFSNQTKQVVPFTDDVDHVNARIEALNKYRTLAGTSNLTLAINEAAKQFSDDDQFGGNILVFTDAEEHSGKMDLDIKKNISLGIVGVGTARGGKIPIRDNYNILRGYKKHQGEEVLSKLNEDFLKKSFEDIKNYNYWIVSGYAMPTTEILDFLKNSFIAKKSETTQSIRPVWAHYLLFPGFLMLLLSYVLGHMKLVRGVGLVLILMMIPNLRAEVDEGLVIDEKEQAVFEDLIERHKKGELTKDEEKYLAGKYLKIKDFKTASTLYDETIKFPEHENAGTLMNYGTSLIGKHNFTKGVDMLEMALSKLDKDDEETREQIKQNILLALKQEEEKKQQEQQKQKENQEQQENKEDQKNQEKNNEEEQNEKEQKEQKGNQGPDKNEKKQKQKEGQQKKGLSALMKEILNDDKKLQKKLLDTSTGTRGGGSNVKDW